jgi:hypothetical protein
MRKRARLRIAAFAAAVGIMELAAYVLLYAASLQLHEPIRRRADIYAEQSAKIARLLELHGTRREILDPVLGWRYRPGFQSDSDTISVQGLRSTRLYAATPSPGVRRVAVFGDSFVYGNEVADDDAWAAIIERLSPRLEVLNYGVGGYGVDQAYLRYLIEGRRLEPHVVIMGFVPDDLRRVVNVYRRFISTQELPFFKPRFVLTSEERLELIPVPAPDIAAYTGYLTEPQAVQRVGVYDQWYEPLIYENFLHDWSAAARVSVAAWTRVRRRYIDKDRLLRGGQFNPRSEAFRIQVALFRAFENDVRASGAVPLVLFFPDREALTVSTPVYQNLLQVTRDSGVPVADLAAPFARAAAAGGVDHLFMPGGHYSPAGNRVAAHAVAAKVMSLSGG